MNQNRDREVAVELVRMIIIQFERMHIILPFKDDDKLRGKIVSMLEKGARTPWSARYNIATSADEAEVLFEITIHPAPIQYTPNAVPVMVEIACDAFNKTEGNIRYYRGLMDELNQALCRTYFARFDKQKLISFIASQIKPNQT